MRFIIKVDQTDEQEVLSNTHTRTHKHTHTHTHTHIYIYYLVCGFGSFLLKKSRKKLTLPYKKRITKHKNCERTNGSMTHYVMYFNETWDN